MVQTNLTEVGVWYLLNELSTEHDKGLSPGPVGRVCQLKKKFCFKFIV
jgi:hypothetical protein